MAQADRLYWLQALTPLHVGMGRGEGYIDMPILREKVTDFPFVPGSSMKGVLADWCGATAEARDPNSTAYRSELHAAFGRAGDDLANSGALVFTDARLVCLAVRSLYGTFAWCTSPLVLRRLSRDLDAAGFGGWPAPPPVADKAHVPCGRENAQGFGSCLGPPGRIYLEDLDLAPAACPMARDWATRLARQFLDAAWQAEFIKRFAVLPDDVFGFLAETATEVQAHVRIDPDFKRVESGALWYEESLPAESILGGLVWCDEPRGVPGVLKTQVLDLLQPTTLQMGGKATTGKGRVQVRFSSAATDSIATSAASPAKGDLP